MTPTPALLYIISLLGAAGIFLLLRSPEPTRAARPGKALGIVLALAALAWMLAEIGRALSPVDITSSAPEAFYTIFTLIALAAAVRMITHHRPVYAALYFVMVVLSSAGMFLLLAAEFMAFALIIVYAGAILITYLFVLMLAQQADSPDSATGQPEYDRLSREPALASGVGFLLIALLSHVILGGTPELDAPPSEREAVLAGLQDLELMPRELAEVVDAIEPGAEIVRNPQTDSFIWIDAQREHAWVTVLRPGESEPVNLPLPDEADPGNIKRVGLALVAKFPVSLEVAGIILLLAMFGAVVLARRQIELTEDELREAAGMRRLTAADDEHERTGDPGDRGGGGP